MKVNNPQTHQKFIIENQKWKKLIQKQISEIIDDIQIILLQK